jgi:hypothetical protein
MQTTSTVGGAMESLTMEKLEDMLRDLPPAPPVPFRGFGFMGGVPVVVSPFATRAEETVVTYPGHPMTKWWARVLARVGITFDPDIHVTRIHHKPAAYEFFGRLVVHPEVARMVRSDPSA